jgi:3-methyladenine DNA glycosylase/8-oxoguanine DNA glycosylase
VRDLVAVVVPLQDGGTEHRRVVCDDRSVLVRTSAPVDLVRTLAAFRHGRFDPSFRAVDGVVWRATRRRTGPATLRLRQVSRDAFEADAWGPGADEALEAVPGLLGELDDAAGFDPQPGVVRDAWRRTAAVRIGRSGLVLESLVPVALEQRVISRTAHDAWAWLLRAHGEPAPGPAPDGMRVAPSSEGWAAVPVWDFHRAGVDPGRARTVVAAARLASRLEEAVHLAPADAITRLSYAPGVGPWTAAKVAQRAFGDADAVHVGDFHLPAQVGWALTGARADDAGMLELLEPYRPHRWRVVHHLLAAGVAVPPRRGPRFAVQDHRDH